MMDQSLLPQARLVLGERFFANARISANHFFSRFTKQSRLLPKKMRQLGEPNKEICMKTFLSLALILCTVNAAAMDACHDTLSKYFENEASQQSWGFEALQSITAQDAAVMLESALEDMSSEEAIASAKTLVAMDGFVFYNMLWTAPSNEGNSLIIVDEQSCQIIADVGIWSQE